MEDVVVVGNSSNEGCGNNYNVYHYVIYCCSTYQTNYYYLTDTYSINIVGDRLSLTSISSKAY